MTLVIRGGCIPEYRRIEKKRIKQGNNELDGEGNDMTESKWWGVSEKLRAQLIGQAQKLLPWGQIEQG
jgi:hypothetical protein